MMQRKIVFISGWGTNEDIWLSVKKKWQKFLGDNCSYDYFSWSSFVGKDLSQRKDSNLLDGNIFFPEAEELVLVGWSLGGMIALALSDFCFKNISKMILFSTSARMLRDEGYEGVPLAAIRAMMKKLYSHREVLMKDFFGNCCQSEKSDSVDFLFRQSLSFSTQQLFDGLEYLRYFDRRKDLPHQKISTLIFHGFFDKIIPPVQAEYLKEKMPNATIKYMRAGHDLLFSHGGEVEVAVKEFLCE